MVYKDGILILLIAPALIFEGEIYPGHIPYLMKYSWHTYWEKMNPSVPANSNDVPFLEDKHGVNNNKN